MSDSAIGLYIHVPFCRAKCAYCDFNSYPHVERLHEPYVQALCADMHRFAQQNGRLVVDTIYVGGGTPTCLVSPLLTQILTTCKEAFAVEPGAEITCEANPGTVTPESLSALRHAGVNRLSLGAQSLHDDELRLLGRIHRAEDIKEAVWLARSAGIHTISLDLIYGLPQQALAAWRSTLEGALALAPDHLSLYALSVEEGTPLAQTIASGQLPQPDPDLAADMYVVAEDRLAEADYQHYELSNWARLSVGPAAGNNPETRFLSENGFPTLCHHNLKYWRREPYLGFGVGAHSCYAGRRYHNVPNPQDYITRLESGQSTVESEEWIEPGDAMAETMILGLRLIEGIRFERFRQQHGREMRDEYPNELDELQTLGLLTSDRNSICLTARGRLLGNQVFGRFWPRPHLSG